MKQKKQQKNRLGNVPVKFDAGRQRWVVSFFVGKDRKRKFFKGKDEAEKEWQSVCARAAEFGKRANAYSPEQHAEFLEAKRIAEGADLRVAARVFIELNRAVTEVVSVGEAARKFIGQKRVIDVSDRHIDTVRGHLASFAASFGELELRMVSRTAVLEWLL